MEGKKLFVTLLMVAAGGLAAFSQSTATGPSTPQAAESGTTGTPAPAATTAPAPVAGPGMLEGLSPEELMKLANSWGMDIEQNRIAAWTTSRAIHFIFADKTRKDVALPDDRMVVSFAPYIMKTHPCKDHTPSSCRGEQADVPVKVKAVAADGTTILDMATQTNANGFVDLWLPRNEKIDVTVETRGLTATERIGTSDSDITCITTMKLHY